MQPPLGGDWLDIGIFGPPSRHEDPFELSLLNTQGIISTPYKCTVRYGGLPAAPYWLQIGITQRQDNQTRMRNDVRTSW